MNQTLDAIFQRRAVKVFEPTEIPDDLREQILDAARHAPSSFNTQPYKLYWVQSPAGKAVVAKLCLGQKPAATASALVVAVADLGSQSTTTKGRLEWMRTAGFSPEKIHDYERTARIGRILFMPGPFGIFAAIKRAFFQLLNLRMVLGMPPLSRHDLFKWATKSTSLACQNLMIAAEALGLNTCPMEGFDSRRLSHHLHLSRRHHEIVMVIAVGKRSPTCNVSPQWRRPLNATVTVL
jgi:nitroreductase